MIVGEKMICPTCGHKHQNNKLYDVDKDKTEKFICEKCRRIFTVRKIISIQYETWIEKKTNHNEIL